jgi:hypothetical protein
MRIEKHGNSTYISHSGLGLFINKTVEGYELKFTERLVVQCGEKVQWRNCGIMKVTPEELKLFLSYLLELSK